MRMIPFVFQCVPPSIRVFSYPRKSHCKNAFVGNDVPGIITTHFPTASGTIKAHLPRSEDYSHRDSYDPERAD